MTHAVNSTPKVISLTGHKTLTGGLALAASQASQDVRVGAWVHPRSYQALGGDWSAVPELSQLEIFMTPEGAGVRSKHSPTDVFYSLTKQAELHRQWLSYMRELDPQAPAAFVMETIRLDRFGLLKAFKEKMAKMSVSPKESALFPNLLFPTPIGVAIYEAWPNFPREKDGLRDTMRTLAGLVLTYLRVLAGWSSMHQRVLDAKQKVRSLIEAGDYGGAVVCFFSSFGKQANEFGTVKNYQLIPKVRRWREVMPLDGCPYRVTWNEVMRLPPQLPLHKGKLVHLPDTGWGYIGYGYGYHELIGEHNQLIKLPR